jgi:hypothetical protein
MRPANALRHATAAGLTAGRMAMDNPGGHAAVISNQ